MKRSRPMFVFDLNKCQHAVASADYQEYAKETLSWFRRFQEMEGGP